MSASLLAMLMAGIEELPTLLADAENVFNAVAHGEGGAQKVANVASALAGLSTAAATAAAAATPAA